MKHSIKISVMALIAMFAGKLFDLKIDGWCGMVVSLFVLYSGLSSAKETISPLLGQPPEKELVDEIEKTVMAHGEIIGIHDLVVHDYGPGRLMMSLHAEVPSDGDILEIHDIIDNIEKELNAKFGCEAVVHMDPVMTDDDETNDLKKRVSAIIGEIDKELKMHDFRIVSGSTHTNVLFDVVVPFKFRMNDKELVETIENKLNENAEKKYYAVVNIDRSYV